MNLTRAQQQEILLRANVGVRIVAKRAGIRYSTTLAQDVAEARAELRLDDPVLDELIAQGAHKRPWASPVPARMLRAGTLEA